jgi:hypothetical protein
MRHMQINLVMRAFPPVNHARIATFATHSIRTWRGARSSDLGLRSSVPMGSVKPVPASSTGTTIPDSPSFAFMRVTKSRTKETSATNTFSDRMHQACSCGSFHTSFAAN